MKLAGTVFRAHNPRWSFAPLSGDGAKRYGGRLNLVGVEALYTSLRPETAWLEAQQGFAFKPQPLTICAYAVDCDDVADLTDPNTLRLLHASPGDLACAWESLALRGLTPPSWELAGRLRQAGFAAAIVASSAPGALAGDRNAVFWDWADRGPHKVTVVDDRDRLPRNDLTWR